MQDIEQMEKNGEIFVIRPSRYEKISHMEKNVQTLRKVYELGRTDALAALPAMRKFLEM